jgi:hypothetical protein
MAGLAAARDWLTAFRQADAVPARLEGFLARPGRDLGNFHD